MKTILLSTLHLYEYYSQEGVTVKLATQRRERLRIHTYIVLQPNDEDVAKVAEITSRALNGALAAAAATAF